MTERPILFSGPMVRAILEGRKTMTRRVFKPENIVIDEYPGGGLRYRTYARKDGDLYETGVGSFSPGNWLHYCPYGVPGDRLWVKETWADEHPFDGQILYRERDEYRAPERWTPSIFLPRKYSRILLEVISVRVERVQDISEEDAIAEGMIKWTPADRECWAHYEYEPGLAGRATAKGAFWYLWDSINAKRGFGWDANPFVWVVEFRRIS